MRSNQSFSRARLAIIPLTFTFANAVFGFLSVIKALDDQFFYAALFIILATIMDMLDGRLARLLGTTSGFGGELDSLCDAVSFCLAPAILLYGWSLHQLGPWGLVALGLYLCSGLYRLARFNSLGFDSGKRSFAGLPTTVAAFFCASIVLDSAWIAHTPFVRVLLKPERLAFLMVILALLMMSTIRFPSAKRFSWGWRIDVLLALGALAGIAGSYLLGYPILLWVSAGYIIVGFITGLLYELMRLLR